MLKALGCHDRVQCVGTPEEVNTGLPEPVAPVLLREHQHGRSCVDLYLPAQFLLTNQLQPLHVVPVRRFQQVVRHGSIVFVVLPPSHHHLCRQRISVDEMQKGLKHPRQHITDPYYAAGPRARRRPPKELCLEHSRAGGENAPVRTERLGGDLERDIGAFF